MARKLSPGDHVGGFRILAQLGQGGMGVVFKAQDTKLRRTVALKVLKPDQAADRDQQRFVREAQAQAALDHPHILPVWKVGEVEGFYYISMKLVQGHDFAEHIRAGPVEPLRALYYMDQVAKALDHAHAAGLIHRDLKPANILVDVDKLRPSRGKSHLYLADFGLAWADHFTTLTQVGMAMGTPAYMAPEQWGRERVDARADVYALACILYECVAGVRPPGAGPHGVAAMPQLYGPAGALNDALRRGLAARPDQRFSSCGEMIAACTDALRAADRPTPGVSRLRSLRDPAPREAVAREPQKPAAAAGLGRGLGRLGRRDLRPGARVRIRIWSGSFKPADTGLPFAIHGDRGRTGTVVGWTEGLCRVRWDAQEWSKVNFAGLKGRKVSLPSFEATISSDWLGNA